MNGTKQDPLLLPSPDPNTLWLGMFHDIVQRFLNDSIERCFRGTRQAPRRCGFDMDLQASAFRDPFGQKTDCRNPTEIIENGWSKFMRVSSQMPFDFPEQSSNLVDLLLGCGKFSRHLRQCKVYGHQKLSSFVMHGIRDTFDLLFECFVELP